MATSAPSQAELIQNPVFGATLMWRFGLGYQERSLSEPPTLPLFFIVLPVCIHAETIQEVLSTRKSSGLALFAAKVGEVREDLLAIHERALRLRDLTLESIGLAVQYRWLTADYSKAELRANQSRGPTPGERIKPMWDAAEKFGYWCAGAGLKQTTLLLQMAF